MILDKIENIGLYKNIGERINKAIIFIQNNDLHQFDLGKHEIDGENIFVLIQEYDTKEIVAGKMEAHKKYIDIQIMLREEEVFGYEILQDQQPETAYSEERDVMFFQNKNASFFTLHENNFAIFYPGDIHMPGIKSVEINKVKKAVFKVKFEQ